MEAAQPTGGHLLTGGWIPDLEEVYGWGCSPECDAAERALGSGQWFDGNTMRMDRPEVPWIARGES